MNDALCLGRRFAAAKRDAEAAIARLIIGTREDEIAKTRESHKSFAQSAELDAQPHHFGETARNQCDARIGPVSHAVCYP
jgi:proteasome lid subunit RPN8/RPN11